MSTITLKTNECLNIMQQAIATGTPIHLTSFKVSSTAGDFDANRTLGTMNPSWYDGVFTESPVPDPNQELKVFIDIPENLDVPASSVIREIYVIGEYDSTEFLFSIIQITGKTLEYIPDAGYYFTVVYKLNSLGGNPDLLIIDTEKNFEITLNTAWTELGTIFYQDVEVLGLNSSQRPIIGLVQSNNDELASTQRGEYGKLLRAVSMNDAIRFYAGIPTDENLTVQVKIFKEQE